jgi:hypothetical protein
MLRFPVSLLTATAIRHAIRRVAHHRPSPLKGERAVECPNCACDCHTNATASGKSFQNTVLEQAQSDADLSMQRSISGVLEDIREVLGLPVVRSTRSGSVIINILTYYLRRRSRNVRSGSHRCVRLQRSLFTQSTFEVSPQRS